MLKYKPYSKPLKPSNIILVLVNGVGECFRVDDKRHSPEVRYLIRCMRLGRKAGLATDHVTGQKGRKRIDVKLVM